MAADGQVVFEINGDNSGARASINETTDALGKACRKWEKSASDSSDSIEDAFSSMLKNVAAGFSAAAIGKKLLDIGNAAIQAASDLAEVQNVVDVTFGDNASKIESWSKKAGAQFGMTETQAKRFSSTLGAMMKSAGLAGDSVADMSMDMAGLAADMASFYNMDFDTAFEKIRSGLSGQTEPLKQLGINMSVANLQAFALKQGITKAFDKMSQGEQTVLRYQYLMQATADAQGDFARTSDGFANACRKMETNIESLKTKLGEVFLPVVEQAISGINSFLDILTDTSGRTVLDEFNDIDLDTATKLADIEKVSEQATALTAVLEDIGKSTSAQQALGKMADGANKLNASAPGTWTAMLTALEGVDGLQNIFSNNSAGKNIEELSNALTGSDLDMTKAEAWQVFLGTLSDHADAVSKLTGSSVEETKKWLDGLAESAKKLDPNTADGWDTLLTSLSGGLSGTAEGQEFINNLATQFLAMGAGSTEAAQGLKALGFNEDEIADKQKLWLATCKELVKTIPGLNSIINTETGEVEGGTDAIKEYVQAWEEGQTKLALLQAHQQKQEALNNKYSDLPGLELDKKLAEHRIRKNMDAIKAIYDKYGIEFNENTIGMVTGFSDWDYEDVIEIKELVEQYSALRQEKEKATEAYDRQKGAYDEAVEALKEEDEMLQQLPGDIETVTDATVEWSEETQTAATKAVESLQEALTNLNEYVKGVRDATKNSIDSVVNGFGTFKTALQRYEALMDEFNDLGAEDQKKYGNDWTRYADEKTVSIGTMKTSLQNQRDYLKEYQDNMKAVKAMGASDALLAALSDGSTESSDYLFALARSGNKESIAELNELYKEVQEGKEELTETLTQQKLAGDEQYDALVKKAQESVQALNLEGVAKDALGDTVAGIAQGIKDHVPEVKTQVDAILEELNRLNSFNLSFSIDSFLSNSSFGGGGSGSMQVTPLAVGMDYVPFDNYLAALHEGESVLTAEEARVWRNFKNGGASSSNVDYGTMGDVMRDNIKPGGDVYMNGRVVGQVLSEEQAKSYRNLTRSGWQQ